MNKITSTSRNVFLATFNIKSPSLCLGLWIPGVSIKIIWLSVDVSTPCTLFRVVCGLSLMIAIFWPMTRFKNVDLPTLGRPIIEIKPDL